MSELKVGQLWMWPGSEEIPPLYCVIGRLSQTENGVAVSVWIMPHPEAGEVGWPTVSHAPILEQSVRDSGMTLMGEDMTQGPNEDFEEGHATWRALYDKGEAGVFTLGVSETYAAVVTGWRDGEPISE